jgi:thiol-disulfide isomerase/thioredoxin
LTTRALQFFLYDGEENMRMKLLTIPATLLFLLCVSQYRLPALFADNTPAEGDIFPNLKLPLPEKTYEREYLNVAKGPFLLSQVDSEVLIVQIFSMYCPHCQKEAPNVNALYEAITARPETKSHIKVLGIGAGNSSYEVDAFRDCFKVGFSLTTDEDMAVYKLLGRVGTPYFFVLWKKPGGWQVVYSKAGSFGDPKAFLDLICAKTGIDQGK